MPDEPPELSEKLQRTADTLLTTAERCYRLARGITDRQAIEALLRLAEECEQRAEELRDLGET
jgi:hypothetical protein